MFFFIKVDTSYFKTIPERRFYLFSSRNNVQKPRFWYRLYILRNITSFIVLNLNLIRKSRLAIALQVGHLTKSHCSQCPPIQKPRVPILPGETALSVLRNSITARQSSS